MVSSTPENRSSQKTLMKVAMGMRGSEVLGPSPSLLWAGLGNWQGRWWACRQACMGCSWQGLRWRMLRWWRRRRLDCGNSTLGGKVLALREATGQLCPQEVIQTHCTWAGSVSSIPVVYRTPRNHHFWFLSPLQTLDAPSKVGLT